MTHHITSGGRRDARLVRNAMMHACLAAPLLAAVALVPVSLNAQPGVLSPAERAERVNTILLSRIQWLEDDTPVDPCSALRATGDTGFLERMDGRARSLLLDVPTHATCTPLGPGSRISHVQVLRVTGSRDSVVVTLLVHGHGIGSVLRRHRYNPTGSWYVEIEHPVAQHDRAPQPSPAGTSQPSKTTVVRAVVGDAGSSLESVVALAAAIAVMPVSEVNQRVMVREEVRREAEIDGPALVALEQRLGDIHWFETIEEAKQYCDVRAGGCVQSSVKSIEKTGVEWRIVISQSMLSGCGFQHFVVKAYVTAGVGVVRSVTAADSGSCGVRR